MDLTTTYNTFLSIVMKPGFLQLATRSEISAIFFSRNRFSVPKCRHTVQMRPNKLENSIWPLLYTDSAKSCLHFVEFKFSFFENSSWLRKNQVRVSKESSQVSIEIVANRCELHRT